MIAKMLIPIPPYEEQIKIMTPLLEADKFIITEQNNLSKLHLLKTGLMQDLLSGRVRVKVREEIKEIV